MQSSFIDRFTRGFFWFGFCVFLGASIPHIASYYRHFDPNATGITDITDWTIGYLIAIVIDVTDVLVSVAVLKEINRGTKKHHLLGYWAFILFVMALSWLINWQYNIVYQTNAFAKADGLQMFSFPVTVGTINPIVGSAFQLLLLVYTAMAHKFTVQPVKKTAEQLRQEADELEQVAMQQARIDAVKKMQSDNKVGGIFDSLGQAKERAKTLFGNGQSVNDEAFTSDAFDEDESVHEGRTTDPLKAEVDVEELSDEMFTPLPLESEQECEETYVTEEMPIVTLKPSQKRASGNTTSKRQKVQKLLAKYPDASQSVIAKKAQVAPSYVSRISKDLTTAQ